MQDFRMETFLAVCRGMNYTKAAEELCITQPAVSQHIRHLEEHYGAKLFVSEGKKMMLTEAGRLLYSAGLTMRHDENALQERMTQAKGQGRSLNVGATLTIGEYMLPERLNRYLTAYPSVSARIRIGNTEELLQLMDKGELDFALVEGYFSRNDYDCRVFSTEKYIAAAGQSYHFRAEERLGRKPERAEELLPETVIVREPGSGGREVLERFLKGKNFSIGDFGKQIEVNNIKMMKYLAGRGRGIVFLFEAAVRRELEEGKLIKVELKDFYVEHDFYFVWRKGSIFTEEYQEIFERLTGEGDVKR